MPAKPSPSFVSTVISFFGDPRKPEERKTLGQKIYWGVIAFGLFMAVSMLATIPSGRASENVIPSLLTGVFLIALTVAVGRKPRKPLAIAASVVLFISIGATTPASSRTGDGGADPTPGASSKPTPNSSSAPSNRCWWRYPSKRLGCEIIRLFKGVVPCRRDGFLGRRRREWPDRRMGDQ